MLELCVTVSGDSFTVFWAVAACRPRRIAEAESTSDLERSIFHQGPRNLEVSSRLQTNRDDLRVPLLRYRFLGNARQLE